MKVPIAALLLAALLSGCTAPTPPTNAVHAALENLDGADLYGWVVEGEDRVTLEGLFFQHTGDFLVVREGYHTSAFKFEIRNETGEALLVQPRQCRENFYNPMSDRDYAEFRFTWLGKVYDHLEACRDGQPSPYSIAPSGNYTLHLSFELRDYPADSLFVDVPFVLPSL